MCFKGTFGSRVGGDDPKVVETQPETGIWAFMPNTCTAALQNLSSAITEGLSANLSKGRAGLGVMGRSLCLYAMLSTLPPISVLLLTCQNN